MNHKIDFESLVRVGVRLIYRTFASPQLWYQAKDLSIGTVDVMWVFQDLDGSLVFPLDLAGKAVADQCGGVVIIFSEGLG